MATIQRQNEVNLDSGVDLTERQFHFVSMASNGGLALTGAGGRAVGVLLTAPNANESGSVLHSGVAKVKSAGELDEGDLVASNASGRAVEAASGNVILGIAVSTSTSSGGEFVEVLLGSHASVA